MYFGCSKEPSHWDGSFEYPQHMYWMRNKENNFPIHTLIWRPVTDTWTGWKTSEYGILINSAGQRLIAIKLGCGLFTPERYILFRTKVVTHANRFITLTVVTWKCSHAVKRDVDWYYLTKYCITVSISNYVLSF